MKFIKVTIDGSREFWYINVDVISHFYEVKVLNSSTTYIVKTDGKTIVVKNSSDELFNLIKS